MNPSPYAPPVAPVSDPVQVRGPVPPALRRAGQLLWVSVAMSVVLMVLTLVGVVESANLVAELISALVSTLLLVLMAAKVGAGRNWARWLFVVMYLLGTGMFVVMLIVMPQAFFSLAAIQQISAVVQLGAQTVALVLVFVRPARQWYAAG